MKISYTLYMLRCSDQSLYTGYTRDLKKRLDLHASGRGSKYVYSRRPFKLVYQEHYSTQRRAMQREIEIKQMKRSEKEEMIKKNSL